MNINILTWQEKFDALQSKQALSRVKGLQMRSGLLAGLCSQPNNKPIKDLIVDNNNQPMLPL